MGMNVLHITKTVASQKLNGFYGYEIKHFSTLADILGENHVLCEASDHRFRTVKPADNLYFHMVPFLFFLPSAVYVILNYEIDLIVPQNPFFNGIIATLASLITRKPMLCTVHGYDFKFDLLNWRFRILQWPFRRYVLKRANLISCDTEAVKNVICSWGISPRKVMVVGSYVDTQLFNPKISGSKVRKELGIKDKPIVLYCGKLDPVKGVKRLLRAVKGVLETFDNVSFVIAGDGPLRAELEDFARKIGVSEAVIFTGWIDYDKVPYFMSAANIYAHPAYSEAFGKACAEASACAKPVVAFKVGGIPEVIIDEETGILVENGDISGFSQAIVRLLNDKKLRWKFGKKGRRFVSAKFDFKKRERRLAEIYFKAAYA